MDNKKMLLDSNILISLIDTKDDNHYPCSSFYEKYKDEYTFYIPSIAYFEFQATQSRIGNNYREIYIENLKEYKMNNDFIKKCCDLDLFNKFNKLKGADLIYACISKIENIPLATNDKDFKSVESEISVLWVNKK